MAITFNPDTGIPLITTINDLVAVVSYYGLSWLFLIEFFHMAG